MEEKIQKRKVNIAILILLCVLTLWHEPVFAFTLSGTIVWLRDSVLALLWNVIEIILSFLFIMLFMVWFFLTLRGRRSLNVLPITNETGDAKELQGIAAGIDDLLITKLQDIKKLSKLRHYGLLAASKESEDREDQLSAKAERSDISGGGVIPDLQKLGDISVGPVKIPLGSLIAFITKMFGGNYVSGALQKYGAINKIVLRLEQKPSIPKPITTKYLEVSWPSDTFKEEKLPEGVLVVVEELAYRIILELEDVGTRDWRAYKHFLEGNAAFSDYGENFTRKDRLRDAIASWHESLRLDPHFSKAHYNLGIANDIEAKYADAIFHYQKAIQLSPELIGSKAYYNLANLYWTIYKDENKTLAELKKAREIDPDSAKTYNLEGLVQSWRRDDSSAALLYEKAIELSLKKQKPDPVFHYNLGVAYYYLRDFDRALAAGNRALEIYWDKARKELYGSETTRFDATADRIKDLVQTIGWIQNVRELLQTMGYILNRKGALASAQGNLSLALDNYRLALSYFEEGLKTRPDNKDMLDGYAEALRETDDPQSALLVQRRLIRLWPEYPGGYYDIAQTMRKLHLPEDEIMVYEKIGQLLDTEDILKAARAIEDNLKQTNVTPYHFKIYAGALGGLRYYRSKDLSLSLSKKEDDVVAEAVASFEDILKHQFAQSPYLLEPESLHNYALALLKLKKYKDAATQLEMAVTLYQDLQAYDLAQAYSALAEAYRNMKRYQDADRAYQYAIYYYTQANLTELASNSYVLKAKCLIENRYYYHAKEDCDKAIHLNNANADAFHVKGNTYYYQGFYADAIPQYEKSIEINFDLPGAHYALGLCYFNMQDYERAEKKFETTIKLYERYGDPDSWTEPDAYQWLAYCLEKQVKSEKIEKAVTILRDAANIFPNAAKYRILLGKALAQSNLPGEAAVEFRAVINSDKENIKGLCNLAALYGDQGIKITEAYIMCRKALINGKTAGADLNELAEIRGILGWLCYQRNYFKKAFVLLENALSYDLGNPVAHARFAHACERCAEVCADPDMKTLYADKAETQWKAVIKADTQGIWAQAAEEHIKLLSAGRGASA